eukprot:5410918-Amphidinium_carterae.1
MGRGRLLWASHRRSWAAAPLSACRDPRSSLRPDSRHYYSTNGCPQGMANGTQLRRFHNFMSSTDSSCISSVMWSIKNLGAKPRIPKKNVGSPSSSANLAC